MKETHEKLGLNRRDFMKISAAALTGCMLGQTPGLGGLVFGQSLPAGQFDREVFGCCIFCQTRCTTLAQVKNDRVVNVYGHPKNEWTGGGMCPKGKAMVELTYSPHRLMHPLLRQGDEWVRIPYKQAVELAAEKLLEVKKKFPEDFAHRVALFAPLWESRESELAAEMVLNLAGFPDVSHPGDTCMGNAGTALGVCLGSPISETTGDELPKAELVVLFGANITVLYPPYVRWLQMAREHGVKLVYVDPRITPTANFCDIHLRPRPGTDGALALGIMNYLIAQDRYDREFVASKVNGFEVVADSVKKYNLEAVSKITCLSEDEIRNLADLIGRSRRTIVWLGGSLSRYTNAIQTARAIIALQAITGNLAGEGKGILHVQSGKPGGDHDFTKKFSAPDLERGLNFRKILFNMERGDLKVLLLNSSYRRYPDANRVKKAIENVDFVIHRGFFMNEEAKVSDLIIPGTMGFESEGSQYGLWRQVVWREKAIEPLGECVPEWKFYSDLGRMVCGDAYPPVKSPADIYELMRETAPSWAGMSLDRIKGNSSGIVWPCPSPQGSDGRGTLFKEKKFWTEDGKIQLRVPALGPLAWEEPTASPWDDKKGDPKRFPLIFTQGKVVYHWQQSMTSHSGLLAQFSEGIYAQIHPRTAMEFALADGDAAVVSTELGDMPVKVRVSEDVLPGMVWIPHFADPSSPFPPNAGPAINAFIPGYWDKTAAQYNGFGCRLTKITG
jgi:anaerobic selenocysteine-containing dehydrogenase